MDPKKAPDRNESSGETSNEFETIKSFARRDLLRAGWVAPVILAMGLPKNVSAQSPGHGDQGHTDVPTHSDSHSDSHTDTPGGHGDTHVDACPAHVDTVDSSGQHLDLCIGHIDIHADGNVTHTDTHADTHVDV
jgi:hypothetical protein